MNAGLTAVLVSAGLAAKAVIVARYDTGLALALVQGLTASPLLTGLIVLLLPALVVVAFLAALIKAADTGARGRWLVVALALLLAAAFVVPLSPDRGLHAVIGVVIGALVVIVLTGAASSLVKNVLFQFWLRVNVLVVLSVLIMLLVTRSSLWLPPERITAPTHPNGIVAYVLSVDDWWITALLEEEAGRAVRLLPLGQIQSRQYCALTPRQGWRTAVDLYLSDEAGGEAVLPACKA